MILLPAFSLAAGTGGFQGGQKEAFVKLAAPAFEAETNLIVPIRYFVLNASLNVTGLSSESDQSAYPEDVRVLLNESVLWAFNGTGYGPLGRQDRFSDEGKVAQIRISPGGGTSATDVRLPKGAAVQSAVVEVKASPARHWEEMMNFTRVPGENGLGPCACAGDVNRDGYDDFIIGARGDLMPAGYAYLYFGGPGLNNTPGMTFKGTASGDSFGCTVEGAGDVNGDGYDDVIIGAPCNDSADTNAGAAYIFFGGAATDAKPDVLLTGEAEYDEMHLGCPDGFGSAVSGAGDVNGDGYDDVIVGASLNDANGISSGRAYIYFGGPSMDNITDFTFTGRPTAELGYSVSGAGDLNRDGYDDVIVGAPFTDLDFEDVGQAYVYFGGPKMDNVTDVTFTGTSYWDELGLCVARAGDVNNDGFDDVAVGIDDWSTVEAGRVEIFFGGKSMDNNPDVVMKGTALTDFFGRTLSGLGDVNDDGYDDILVAAYGNDTAGENFGRIYIFHGGRNMDNAWDAAINGTVYRQFLGSQVSGAGDVNNDGCPEVLAVVGEQPGPAGECVYMFYQAEDSVPALLDPRLSIGATSLWKKAGSFKGKEILSDFAGPLNDYLRSAPISGMDGFGNSYVDVPFSLTAQNGGNLSLFNLTVEYQYEASVPDFADALNGYIAAHKAEADAGGNLSVPLRISSESPGRIKLSGLEVRLDIPPVLVRLAGAVEMDEDTVNSTLVDLYQLFEDEFDPDHALNFSVLPASNSSIVFLDISDGRYLSADALTGEANDNWTGTVEAIVACTDSRGQRTESNPFTIRVRNVNDPPVITGSPVLAAEPGTPYFYDIIAVDGDRDTLRYSLAKAPANMTVDTAKGKLQWLPRARGIHEVIVAVNDGVASSEQRFTLSVLNRPPRITGAPPLNATVGVPYACKLTAEDPNLDTLNFSLLEGPEGMKVQPGTGRISWIPEEAGEYRVAVEVWDGEEVAIATFSVKATANVRDSETPIFAVAAVLSILLVGLAVGSSTEVGKYRLMMLFLPLYTRMHKEEVLDNETRGMIRGFVAADPGTHYNEIIRRLNLANGEAAYHLSTLEREGYIKSLSDGRLKRFYPADMKLMDIPSRLEPVQRIIYEAIRKSEGLGQREIARALKLPRSTVNRHINRLARLGILRLEKQRFTIKCYVADGAVQKEPGS